VGVLGLGKGARAEPCTERTRAWPGPQTVFFANANNSITASVHGYISDCKDPQKDCFQTQLGEQDCGPFTPAYSRPQYFVENAVPMVRSCGFHTVGASSDGFQRPTKRVAHPGIERNWWVTIKVSGYNVTRKDETDPEVLCLYNIGHRRRDE